MSLDLVITGLLQGLNLALLTYAVAIPFRLLNLPDLSAEGAYPLGGALCASLILLNLPPLVCIALSVLAAGIMGALTSLLYLKMRIHTLLAGIILSTMVYSINLRVMGGPNLSLFKQSNIFQQLGFSTYGEIFLLGLLCCLIFIPSYLFLKTEKGLRFRAVGQNLRFAKSKNINVSAYTIGGFFCASGLSGLAGSLMVQMQSYMDIGMGVGIVIHALAALMLGEVICKSHLSLKRQCIAPLIGALTYQQIQGLALSLGLAPSDLKFFTGAVVLLILNLNRKQCHEVQ